MQIANNVALVTGGASGLGAACVRAFAQAGARVVIADLNEETGQALAQECGEQVVFNQTNVTSESDVQRTIEQAKAHFGGLQIVVNCAGIVTAEKVIGRNGPNSLESFNKVIQINLIGTYNVIRLTTASMIENEANEEGERGVIINTASVAAFEGQIGQAAYAASKGGIVALTLPVAREMARHGIRVMAIAPGIFDTPMMASLPEAARHSLGQQVPFPSRLGRPGEYALLAKQIIENPMLNGEVIRLDGAIRMQPR